jgi:hypothetical protein
MMGRLHSWIERLRRQPRPLRRGDRPAARRRALGFERYESRLALSAATAVDFAADGDLSSSPQLLDRLWMSDVGPSDWVEVSFAPISLPSQAVTTLKMSSIAALTSGNALVTEGGLIGFQFQDNAWRQTIDSNQSTLMTRAAFDQVGGTLNLAVDDGGIFLPSGGELPTPTVPDLNYGADSPDPFNTDPTNHSDLFGDSGESEAEVTLGSHGTKSGQPILRITAPLVTPETEGGRIDVTAMAGPVNLFHTPPDANFDSSLAGTPSAAQPLANRKESPKQLPLENLRARAVVYEVALERDDAPAVGERHDPSAQGKPKPPGQAAATPAHEESTPVAKQPAADAADAVATTGEGSTTEQSTSAIESANDSVSVVSAARDAALAALDDEAPASDDASTAPEAGLALADARSQRIGLALALAVGGIPLVRRYRGHKATPASERRAGLQ